MATSTQRQRNIQFNSDFWTHYADRHPDDGVRPGFKGYNPEYRVPGTAFIIKRYHAGRDEPGNRRVGLGVVTPENRSFRHGQQPRVRPYVPALAKALGYSPNGNSAWVERRIEIGNRDNWTEAVDWLHEIFEIYIRVLSQPPN